MLTVIILCGLAAVAAGVAVHLAMVHFWEGPEEVTALELALGSFICAVIVIPLITGAGFAIARHSAVTYHEYWNGYEKTAEERVTTCRRDGSCRHEYNCDPYTVLVTHTRTDSKGHTKTYTTTETRWHDCPYVDEEHTFVVTDTLGETYTIGDHWFPENPEKHRWRGGRGLPNVPSGEPALWDQAKQRIDSGNPGGTTQRHDYENFIQASQEDIYDKQSSAIASYKKRGLMPKVVDRVHDFYLADKAYSPGTGPSRWAGVLQEPLGRLNGYVGSVKHGDLHLVIVDALKVPNGDEYTAALDAYWQSPALGKNTLSKNGIVVVVGALDGKVSYARAFTGMPVGNEKFEVSVREDLVGTDVIRLPDTLKPIISSDFKRVQMSDYRYLFDSIQPSGWAKFWIAFVAFLLSIGVWAVLAAYDFLPTTYRKITA